MESLKTRQAIVKLLKGKHPWTAEHTKAMKLWVKEITVPLVLRYGSPSWMGVDAQGNSAPLVTGVISAGIAAGFFSIHCAVHPGGYPGTSPREALLWANAISEVALWCTEVATCLEEASILAKIPARNGCGFSGVARFPRKKPALPMEFPRD